MSSEQEIQENSEPPVSDSSVTGEIIVKVQDQSNQALSVSWIDASFILAILTVFVYLAGRLYTEQYYGQFAVNFRSLDFSTATYMFNGWNVLSTSITILIASILIFLRCFTIDSASIISIVILTIVWVIVWIVGLEVATSQPTFPFDLVTQVVCVVIVVSLLWCCHQPIKAGIDGVTKWVVNDSGVSFPAILLTTLLALWFYILIVTSGIASHHAKRAKGGGIGVKIVQMIEHSTALDSQKQDTGCWWLLLTRTKDGRVLLYRPKDPSEESESIFVPDKAIALTRDYEETKLSGDSCTLPTQQQDTNTESSN